MDLLFSIPSITLFPTSAYIIMVKIIMAQPSLHYNIRVFTDIMGFYMNVGILKQAFFRELVLNLS